MSAKFKISLKIQGFELEVEGSREDIPLLTKNVSDQLAGMLIPAANMIEGKSPAASRREPIETVVNSPDATTGRKRARSRAATSGTKGSSSRGGPTITWVHDANVFGTPLQSWKAADKAMWLLHVATKAKNIAEMSAHEMVTTFDQLFRTAGRLNRGNLGRDFGKVNAEPPPKVSMNGTVDPPKWYLTDAGIKHAEGLVKAARGEAMPQE